MQRYRPTPSSFEDHRTHIAAPPCFGSGFDHSQADKQVLGAEGRVAHPLGVAFEVFGFGTQFFGKFGVGTLNRAQDGHQSRELAFVQPTFLVRPDSNMARLLVSRNFAITT